MNKDQVEGRVDQVKGKIKEVAGKVTGNESLRQEGVVDQVSGKTQATYGDVKDSFTCREVDWVRVKGKNEPIRIFELICEGPSDATRMEMLKCFQEGFEIYHQKNFTAALEKFKKALEILPGDPPSELYVERCGDYLTEPPPENWDGVYVMKTK